MSHLVSIIMPSFNCEEFISETILSVISQTYKNWELIIVDDCSTDNSVNIINHFNKYDKRIHLILNDKNKGAAISRNKAIEYASGKYIAFLDSDDLWNADKLQKQISYMSANDLVFSYSAYETIDEQGMSLNRTIVPREKLDYLAMLKENQIGCLTAIYDQEILNKHYMPLIRKRQDYGLWLSILKTTPYAYRAPGILAKYRIRENSISSSKIGLLKYNFKLFHTHEKISKLKSFYYVGWNIYRKLKK
ncbi:glycosyltransferase family 2 protein [Psychromonas sp. SA13A]|uniref:glycosyltransferase family 2 protein n=1 Tax=Psychromonas sp. SA13A TaxID=2686346 RepID=UPI00140761B5|nr:glycosyltransferase family 2 protein [Psychromonas sp. SA13A]